MKRLLVICCCDPTKVLGSMEVPDEMQRDGAKFRLMLQSELADFYRADRSDGRIEIEDVTIEVAKHSAAGLAVKSNDIPIETFRRIRSFRESAA